MAKGYKTGGREQGTPNKLTKEIREQLEKVFKGYDFQKDINKLEPKDRVQIMTRLLEYITPKYKSTDIKVSSGNDNESIVFMNVSVNYKVDRDGKVTEVETND